MLFRSLHIYIKFLGQILPNLKCAPHGWSDTTSTTCDGYKSKNWCTSSGAYGTGWDSTWGTFETNKKYEYSGQDCVECGCVPECPSTECWTFDETLGCQLKTSDSACPYTLTCNSEKIIFDTTDKLFGYSRTLDEFDEDSCLVEKQTSGGFVWTADLGNCGQVIAQEGLVIMF